MKKTVDMRPNWPLFSPHWSWMTLITGDRMLRSAYMNTQPRENSAVTAMGPGRLPLTGRKRRDDGDAWVSVVAGAWRKTAERGFCSVVTFMEGLLKAVEDWFLGRTNSQARPRIRPKTPQL